ncbi:hypothetical protein T11_17362 [Trichinella zimbabwensis]|uniref:Uncharacterized protein n=1 Tax=Trichinella zimbabwensis TaxID=268475 RepID=A0A0V1GWA1_9BILA|nr:hypothetical protein T11_17362 [Trichinella zimbabwensis]
MLPRPKDWIWSELAFDQNCIEITDNDDSARKSTNNYLCLSTCRVTRAVHLELVSKMAIGRLLQASYILHSSAPPSTFVGPLQRRPPPTGVGQSLNLVVDSLLSAMAGQVLGTFHLLSLDNIPLYIQHSRDRRRRILHHAVTFVRVTVHLHVPLNCSGYQGLTRLAGVLILESDNYQCFLWRDTDTDPQKC